MLTHSGYGFGYSSSGYGYGSGDGCGSGYGFGYGSGSGSGKRLPNKVADFEVSIHPKFSVLVIGCEAHTVKYWRNAGEEIAERNRINVTPELQKMFQKTLEVAEGST